MRSRRAFIKLGYSVAAAGAVWPRRILADIVSAQNSTAGWAQIVREVAAPSEIAARALDAAKTAGAIYADVNIHVLLRENWGFLGPSYGMNRNQDVGFGVRALFNGYWGFSGSQGIVSADEAAAMGQDATRQARNAAKGKPRTVDLGTIPVAAGSWTTPIEIDPFTVTAEEKADYFAALSGMVSRLRHGVNTAGGFSFKKADGVFASSEGASIRQTIYTTGGGFGVDVPPDWMTERFGNTAANFLNSVGAGWEYILKSPLRDHSMEMIDEAFRRRRPKPVDIGRYDIVLDAEATAGLLGSTIGEATPIDRVMGYRANDEGTSYITDPLTALGTFQMGAPSLTISANRTMPQGVATVKWDDEGVEPQESVLVKDGVLADLQTTRESASWIAPYYQKINKRSGSNGCAGMNSFEQPVQQVMPNLVMKPGVEDVTFTDLVKNTKKGLAFIAGNSYTDQQVLNGTGYGSAVYQITNGQFDGTIEPVQFIFRNPDFWKNLVAIGGKRSVQTFGINEQYSVSAVPIQVKNVAVTDPTRKA